MTRHLGYSAIAVFALCLLGDTPLHAQRNKKWTPAEIFANVKVGQWIEIEGAVQPDQSVTAVEIEFRTGDLMDDDWQLQAKVKSVAPEKSEFQVFSVPVRATKDTEFDDDLGGVNDLKPEMSVKLEGTYLNEGIFLAKEVDIRTRKRRAEPRTVEKVEVVGKVAQIDEAKQVITVMGIRFHINEQTEGKSLIK